MSASELENTFAMQLDAVGLDGYVKLTPFVVKQ